MTIKYGLLFSLVASSMLAETAYYHEGKKVELTPIKEVRSLSNSNVKYYLNNATGQKVGLTAKIIFSAKDGYSVEALTNTYNLTNVNPLTNTIYSASVSSYDDAITISAKMFEDGVVKYAHPNFVNNAKSRTFTPSTNPLFPKSWHLTNTSNISGANINVMEAWNITRGKGVKVAVYDDAILETHEDLAPNFVAKIDALSDALSCAPITSEDTHGTFVAGLAVATSNDKGSLGVAPEASLVGIRGVTGGTTNEQDIKIFNYVKNNDIAVMNNSWGSYQISEGLKAAVQDTIAHGRGGKGTVVVFAYGNDGCNDLSEAPCKEYGTGVEQGWLKDDESSVEEVFTVVALNHNNKRSSYSNYGTKADIAAPGGDGDETKDDNVGMVSTTNDGTTLGGYDSENPDQIGTSYAAPVVAGAVALVVAANPDLTSTQVMDIIKETADKVGGYTYDANGRNHEVGHGKINVARAVAKAVELKNASQPKTLTLASNWNLVSHPTNVNLDVNAINTKFANIELVWKFVPPSTWQAFSSNDATKSFLTANNITNISSLDAGDGYWVKATNGASIAFDAGTTYDIKTMQKFTNANGWVLLGTGTDVSVGDLVGAKNNIFTIWKDVNTNGANTWHAYSPNAQVYATLQGMSTIKTLTTDSVIKAGEGFWVHIK